jgi:hypothetical protein
MIVMLVIGNLSLSVALKNARGKSEAASMAYAVCYNTHMRAEIELTPLNPVHSKW